MSNQINMDKIEYSIQGNLVSKNEFDKLKSTLDISKDVSSSASIVPNMQDPISNPEGSEINFEARDLTTGKKYRYSIITYSKTIIYEIREI